MLKKKMRFEVITSFLDSSVETRPWIQTLYTADSPNVFWQEQSMIKGFDLSNLEEVPKLVTAASPER